MTGLATVITDAAFLAEFEAAKAKRGGVPPLPIPDDFAANVGGKSNYALARHYGVNAKVVQRWRVKAGIVNPHSRHNERKDIPAAFAEAARNMGNAALIERFGVSKGTIIRWRAAVGVPAPDLASANYRKLSVAKKRAYAWSLPDTTAKDGSVENMAADHLRPFAPTYRCDERGRMDPRGSMWRYGMAILTPAEMMERAKRKGWRG